MSWAKWRLGAVVDDGGEETSPPVEVLALESIPGGGGA